MGKNELKNIGISDMGKNELKKYQYIGYRQK